MNKARQYGKQYAKRMFQDLFKYPSYRGKYFTWASFPGQVACMAETNVFTAYAQPISRSLEAVAANAAYDTAAELVVKFNLASSRDVTII